MQPSIPRSNSVSAFVIEGTVIVHSLKCIVPFSLVLLLLSLAVIHCYLLSLVVTHCCLLSLVVTRCITCCHSLSLVAPLVANRCPSLYYSLSLDVPLVCLFINGHLKHLFRRSLFFVLPGISSFQILSHGIIYFNNINIDSAINVSMLPEPMLLLFVNCFPKIFSIYGYFNLQNFSLTFKFYSRTCFISIYGIAICKILV